MIIEGPLSSIILISLGFSLVEKELIGCYVVLTNRAHSCLLVGPVFTRVKTLLMSTSKFNYLAIDIFDLDKTRLCLRGSHLYSVRL